VLEPGNTAVKQIVNADPSFYLNNVNQTQYSIDGTWQVQGDAGDDDYMGFVFGYQNSSNFYLFDWKQGTQGYVNRTAAEGMTIKRFTGATGNGLVDLSLEDGRDGAVGPDGERLDLLRRSVRLLQQLAAERALRRLRADRRHSRSGHPGAGNLRPDVVGPRCYRMVCAASPAQLRSAA